MSKIGLVCKAGLCFLALASAQLYAFAMPVHDHAPPVAETSSPAHAHHEHMAMDHGQTHELPSTIQPESCCDADCDCPVPGCRSPLGLMGAALLFSGAAPDKFGLLPLYYSLTLISPLYRPPTRLS